ncbi:site-specific integrase [Caballeronia sp. LZ043]|uniref:site-specific integrase n=1 Tax=Caballeronia sp. LZ043 TaxID=3038569 RepID=UPI00285EC0BA|nr:site-specific integrase [Caballeronia sp. LZ043]MDR5819323.1 site-specific integrase [Caballeronia sp. LZ043]
MKHPYLTTRHGSSNFYYRRKIPLELQPLLNRKDFWRSLETPCKTTAISRLSAAALEYNHLIAPARAQAAAEPAETWWPHGLRAVSEPPAYHPTVQPHGTTRVTSTQFPRLVERFRATALDCDVAFRKVLHEPADSDLYDDDGYDPDAHRSLLLEARTSLRRARASENFSDIQESVEEFLTWERVWLPAVSEEFETLLRVMSEAQLGVVEEELRRLDGEGAETPHALPLVDPDDTWAVAIERWVEDAAPRPKTASEVRAQVARFERLVGVMPLSAVAPEHVAQFKSACLTRESIGKSRVNTILSLLSAVVNHAIESRTTQLKINPFGRAKFSRKAVRKDTAPESQRDAYTIGELNLLYASRVYVSGHRPGKGAHEAAYWLPLLGPHTGARLEDLCRLRTRDVVQRAGVWCLHLHDTKREHRTGEASIMRHVPLHQTLLNLGWLDYVATQDADGLIFPDLKPNQYGQLSAVFSTWFNEYLDAEGLDDPRLDFHSFRHTFKAFGLLSGIDNAVIEELIGHAPDSLYGRNEEGEKRLPFELLVDAMHKLSFPALQLGHLLKQTTTSESA